MFGYVGSTKRRDQVNRGNRVQVRTGAVQVLPRAMYIYIYISMVDKYDAVDQWRGIG